MGLLLYLVGLLALVSGATHLWRRARLGASGSPIAIIETSIGVLVLLSSAMGMSRRSGAPFLVVMTMTVVLISVGDRVRRTMAVRRKRLSSEARRLEEHMKGSRRGG